MMMGPSVALSAQLKRIVAASFIMLGLAAAAAAFAIGFTGALTQSLADPASAPRLRTAALTRLDEDLGYGGFLGAYHTFLLTGGRAEAADLRRLADDADASIAVFARASLSTTDRDYASSLRRLIAPFHRAAIFADGGAQTAVAPVTAARLDRDYATLKQTIAAAAEEAAFARISDLTDALMWSEASSVGALAALVAVLLVLAWFLREHLMAPLSRLRRSLNAAAAGGSEELWGIGRSDEIGAVARAAERLRERTQVQMAAPIPQLHLDIVHSLAKGAVTLEADIAKAAAASAEARLRIEEASLAVANASHAALEAANLARESALRLAEPIAENLNPASGPSHTGVDAPEAVVVRLSGSAPHARVLEISDTPGVIRFPKAAFEDDDTSTVMDALAGGLDRLEVFACERHAIREDQRVALTAALLQAVDRLNAVTYAMADTDQDVIRAAE
ncbi:MAG TPA: hypothetical protein VNH44_17240 [Micropepsaceae bacterium]|nr:hypothetical protein [Micropepsaceae bacterium]